MSQRGSTTGGRERLTEATVRARLRERGQRWTSQRRALIEVMSGIDGHITGAELVERCRAIDPSTIPSTVYRTLDVLEELGLVRHSHGADGREEYHVLPEIEHAHLYCTTCGESWDLAAGELSSLAQRLGESRRFTVDVAHLTISGTCGVCGAR